jgi:hypothetical protein
VTDCDVGGFPCRRRPVRIPVNRLRVEDGLVPKDRNCSEEPSPGTLADEVVTVVDEGFLPARRVVERHLAPMVHAGTMIDHPTS